MAFTVDANASTSASFNRTIASTSSSTTVDVGASHQSTPLHTLLSSPITSTSQLVDYLIPPLLELHNISPHLASLLASSRSQSSSSTAATIIDPHRFIKRQLSLVQSSLITRIYPDWHSALTTELGSSESAFDLLKHWFIPISNDGPFAHHIALTAIDVLTGLLSNQRTRQHAKKKEDELRVDSIEIVVELVVELTTRTVTLDRAYSFAFQGGEQVEIKDERWERVLRQMMNVPTLVANRWGDAQSHAKVGIKVPSELEWNNYNSNLIRSYSTLLYKLASSPDQAHSISSLSSTLSELIPLPNFTSTLLSSTIPPMLPSTTFPVAAETLMTRQRLVELFHRIISELTDRESIRFIRLLFFEIIKLVPSSNDSTSIKAFSWLLKEFIGSLEPDSSISNAFWQVVLDRSIGWNGKEENLARMVHESIVDDEKSRIAALEQIMSCWTDEDGIKAGNLSNRIYLTTLFILSISSFPPSDAAIMTISRSSRFIKAISLHLSILQPSIRLSGMLVAEIVSQKSLLPEGGLKSLNFGSEIWEGDGEGKEMCRRLRGIKSLVGEEGMGWQDLLQKTFVKQQRDVIEPLSRNSKVILAPVEEIRSTPETKAPLISVINSTSSNSEEDDDDDLPSYPLRPSETSLSILAALKSSDPSLYATAIPNTNHPTSSTRKRGKIRAPVYIPELTSYLKGLDPEGRKEEADVEAERVELGLREGEAMVRRKKGWGLELEENAIDLTFALLGLQDQYEIEGFEDSKRKIMIALVSACPDKVAPTIIEQYFTTSYSVAQRHTMLTALALGARELAGLTIEVTASGKLALSHASSNDIPDLFPSKKLPPALHRELVSASSPTPLDALTDDLTRVALSSAREETEDSIPEAQREKLVRVRRFASSKSTTASSTTSTAAFSSLASDVFIMPLINRFWLYLRDLSYSSSLSNQGSYSGGSGSAILLDPLVLSQYLSTLSLLLHASRFSHNFINVLAPESLHLLFALKKETEDRIVVEKELGLILVILDSLVALDHGQAFMTRVEDGAELIHQIQEWASDIFEEGDRSGNVGKEGRVAAGILLRVEEVLSRLRGRLGW